VILKIQLVLCVWRRWILLIEILSLAHVDIG
jgi:hypothetical protein